MHEHDSVTAGMLLQCAWVSKIQVCIPNAHVPEWQLQAVLSSSFESGMRLRKLIEWVSRRVRVCVVPWQRRGWGAGLWLTAVLSMSDGLYSHASLSVCLSSPLSDSLHQYTNSKSHIPPQMKHLFILMAKRINFIHSDASGLIFYLSHVNLSFPVVILLL